MLNNLRYLGLFPDIVNGKIIAGETSNVRLKVLKALPVGPPVPHPTPNDTETSLDYEGLPPDYFNYPKMIF